MSRVRWMKYGFMAVLVMIVIGTTQKVQAEGMGYSVRAIIPENQIDQSKTYFDLLVKPGETQPLVLEIISTSSETLHLNVSPYSATTNQNGELEFSVEPSSHDSSLKYPMSQLVSGSQSVTVPPMATKQVTFTLKVPKESFKGKIVGGFTIYDQENDREEGTTSKNDVQIRNVFSLVIGIRLQEKVDTIQPELRLNQVKADLFNYRTAMTANLQNITPEFIGELKVAATIKKAGSQKVLYESQKSEMTMAPNSNFDFPIMLENQEIGPGNYLLELEATSGQEKWRFNKKFKVSPEEANQLNSQALDVVKTQKPWLMLLTILVVALMIMSLLVVVILTVTRRKK
ncbi:DUF916 and DUF3324 domain-containing protein [uncultured Vagococcus sp.]|uniref:DUF916 and DUF3324 domain-containing protein n=1 Tax=uncultured Vagococcus sp. TaxID=189676 RepID=UPI0028D237DF|nr:DUF916 and DUF3324 domain-containing protein [uncultured Vagococcus sp.]